MITRSNLAEQLREYQLQSKHDWASVSFFSSTSNLSSYRVDVMVFVIWELVILAFLVFSTVSLYFGHKQLAFILYSTVHGGSKCALIRRILLILASEKNWSLTYAPRESNRVADDLDKMALSSVDSLLIFEAPPLRIKEVLQEDNFADSSLMNHSM
ncbi:hypothetical protein J1N35_014141 [Gossypium stocksii]|uniref:Uncharacterized protein n=1 Tax=Gossypium stocksii TaxID=47602 RepID=A0A9D4A8L0_9ROSI|nr:hypothetical protein J1N35_014141 [Gossypium stocksii]